MSNGHRVVRLGSFSKILAPGLRMGWMLSAPESIQRVVDSGLRDMGGGPTPLVAHLLATYCQQGLLEPHIERLRAIYRERRDVMLAALQSHMPAGVRWTQPGGGFFVWLTLPSPMRALEVQQQVGEAGIMVSAGDPFFAEAPTGQHLRLAFSYVMPEQIRKGVEVLGQVLARY
jgi:2-aminoadipate transaminase